MAGAASDRISFAPILVRLVLSGHAVFCGVAALGARGRPRRRRRPNVARKAEEITGWLAASEWSPPSSVGRTLHHSVGGEVRPRLGGERVETIRAAAGEIVALRAELTAFGVDRVLVASYAKGAITCNPIRLTPFAAETSAAAIAVAIQALHRWRRLVCRLVLHGQLVLDACVLRGRRCDGVLRRTLQGALFVESNARMERFAAVDREHAMPWSARVRRCFFSVARIR